MRIALLIGADPRVAKFGPQVALNDGTWRIVVEGKQDSLLRLHHDSFIVHPKELNGELVSVEGPMIVWVEIAKAGTEKFINVFAEKDAVKNA